MPILNKLTGAFPATLIYITVGILIDIWSIVSVIFYPPETREGSFWIVGFLLTGFSLLMIGLFLGRIGRAARQAELPPQEVINAMAQVAQTTAENPPMIAPLGVSTPVLGQSAEPPSSVTAPTPPAESAV